MPNFRAKEFRFLNKEERKTRVIYTPQVLFEGEWCCFADESTESGLIEHQSIDDALKNAKDLYEENRREQVKWQYMN